MYKVGDMVVLAGLTNRDELPEKYNGVQARVVSITRSIYNVEPQRPYPDERDGPHEFWVKHKHVMADGPW